MERDYAYKTVVIGGIILMTPKSYYTINQPLFNSTLSCYIESRTLEIESEIETCAKACKVDKCH